MTSQFTGEEPHICDVILARFIKNQFTTKVTPCQTYWLQLTILFTETLGRKVIVILMPKSALFILFCKTDADFHQRATFKLRLAAYSRHSTSFLDLTCSCRTLSCDTTGQALLHFNLVTAPKCCYLSSFGM